MTLQTFMAVDMLLAEKRGICAIFGDMCCTFIPNNTAPDGSLTRTLEGLRLLAEELNDVSGVESLWLDDLFTQWFGRFKGIFLAVLTSISVFLALLITCGCCCVPMLRSLMVRLISSLIEKNAPPPFQMVVKDIDPAHDSPFCGEDAQYQIVHPALVVPPPPFREC